MMTVFNTLRQWFDDRTARERALLGVCAMLVVGTLLWLLVYRPVHAWREQAADARRAAVIREAVVLSAIAEMAKTPAAFEGDLEVLVTQTAQQAGVSPVLGMSENGDLGFRLDSTSVQPAMRWLAALEQAGVRVTSLSVVENADATVTVEGAVSRRNDR